MSIYYELRRDNDLIIMGTNDLAKFAKVHATYEEIKQIVDCFEYWEAYPIYKAIINRLGFKIKEHDKCGVCFSYSKNRINVRNFDY